MNLSTVLSRAGVLTILFCATAAFPQTKNGSSTMYSASRLVKECRASIVDYDSKRSDIGAEGEHCVGYVQGFVEMATMWQVANEKLPQAQVPMFCLNPKVTNEVIVRTIPIWALEHSEDEKGSAIEFLMSMLVGTYPCRK
jgi:hypothetical protein